MPTIKSSSLATRTLRWVVTASLMVFLVITGAVVWNERSKLIEAANSESRARVASNMPALQLSAWSYNEDGVRAILTALTRSGALVGAQFKSKGLIVLVNRNGGNLSPDWEWSEPVLAPEGKNSIGELHLTESYSEVRETLVSKLLILAPIELLKVVTIATVVLFVVSRMITRPLESLAKKVESLDPLAMDTRLEIEGRQTSDDELGLLVEAINRFHQERSMEMDKRKRVEEELRKMVATDFLTGLHSRRSFINRLEDELARIHRGIEQPIALLMLDLDHFKDVNDNQGHAVGDLVLQHFAALVTDELRRIDMAGRLGGEEFGIVLPGADTESALNFANRLRRRVQESPMRHAGRTISFTVSIGITSMHAADTIPDVVLARADKALYRAKESGRNRVEADVSSV